MVRALKPSGDLVRFERHFDFNLCSQMYGYYPDPRALNDMVRPSLVAASIPLQSSEFPSLL